MTSADYIANRLRDLAAKVAENAFRPTITAHPESGAVAVLLIGARKSLEDAAALLTRSGAAPGTSPAVTDQAAPTPAESPEYLAMGYDGFGGPWCFAQDAAGTVWKRGVDGQTTAHRFATWAAAAEIAGKRGGYPLPAA